MTIRKIELLIINSRAYTTIRETKHAIRKAISDRRTKKLHEDLVKTVENARREHEAVMKECGFRD